MKIPPRLFSGSHQELLRWFSVKCDFAMKLSGKQHFLSWLVAGFVTRRW
jgi:hypothetical protein